MMNLLNHFIFFIVGITFIIISCTTDVGYDLSDKYNDKQIQYKVECDNVMCFCSSNQCSELPECTSEFEGVLFYTKYEKIVYACIEGYWTKKREWNPSADELNEIPEYFNYSNEY